MRTVIVMLKDREFKQRKEEIVKLAENAGYEILGIFSQNSRPRPKFLIGEGKVKEIKKFIDEKGIELVVFENYLTSRQIFSLEKEFKIPVIDKFDLILNVFELHAYCKEAKLQIELARLKRKLPYIKMFITEKVRREHPGFGSSGEYIIHSTLTSIQRRIKKIEKELRSFEIRQGKMSERRRKKGKVVSLVGYTNVGKTTLLNALTRSKQKARDELFTTLRTKTSVLKIDGEQVFVTDTVGFIRNLPHELIYAFRATFKEVENSNLVLLLLDASEDKNELLRKKEICEHTLVKIGAGRLCKLNVLNKIDLCGNIEEIEDKKELVSPCIPISAKHKVGIEELKDEIAAKLRQSEN